MSFSDMTRSSGLLAARRLDTDLMQWSHRSRLAITLVLLAMLGTALLASTLGAVHTSADDWFAGLKLLAFAQTEPLTGSAHVLWHIRLPRVLLAVLIGAALALAGGLAQGLFRNPLADPGLLGVSSGAACATALSLVFYSSMASVPMPAHWRPYLTPLVACIQADRRADTAGHPCPCFAGGGHR